MGFKEVAVAEPYAGLLERGQDTLEDYLNRVRSILGTVRVRTAVLSL